MLDKMLKGQTKTIGKAATSGSFIELFTSGKRRYVIRGITLYENRQSSIHKIQYMFILERIRSDLLNIAKIAREWNLNAREQDLLKLFLSDMCNAQGTQL